MMYFATKNQMMREGEYGGGWLFVELFLFLFLILLTGGVFFLMYLFENLNTRPAGTDEPAYPWEERNRAGFILYPSTLKGRWKARKERRQRCLAA
jgi:hypothetical protein